MIAGMGQIHTASSTELGKILETSMAKVSGNAKERVAADLRPERVLKVECNRDQDPRDKRSREDDYKLTNPRNE